MLEGRRGTCRLATALETAGLSPRARGARSSRESPAALTWFSSSCPCPPRARCGGGCPAPCARRAAPPAAMRSACRAEPSWAEPSRAEPSRAESNPAAPGAPALIAPRAGGAGGGPEPATAAAPCRRCKPCLRSASRIFCPSAWFVLAPPPFLEIVSHRPRAGCPCPSAKNARCSSAGVWVKVVGVFEYVKKERRGGICRADGAALSLG